MSPKLKAFIDFLWKKRTLYVLLGVLIADMFVFLILATPLHVYLPGYLDVQKRAVVMESEMRIDSLERQNDLRMAYLNNMMDILRDRVKTSSLMPYDSTVVRIQDTLLTASQREMLFVENYEKRERFGIEALDATKPGRKQVVFLAPVRGKVAVPDAEEDGPKSETRIELSGDMPVMAPTDGVVVSSVFLLGEGYQITLQHTSDYITIFSHLTSSMVEVGQAVKSGRVVGHAGNAKDPINSWVGVQVWHNGKSVDPEAIMPID